MVRTLALTHDRWARSVDPYRPALELGAVAVTAALHLAWPLTELSRAFLVIPLVAWWAGYLALRWKVDPDAVAALGLRREGLKQSALACAALLAVAGPAMVGWGLLHGAEVPWTTWLTLLVYPVWGLVQQLLVQGLVTANLRRLAPAAVAVFVSAALFGLVHWPHGVLMVATFALGLVFGPLYLKHRNLWALGVAHGWLGTLIYTFVLMRDPLAEYLTGLAL
ncbi:MAG: CPBP family intramembrane metalloprotease [Alphaproteobacteria bacterium]|nr:CPBP family intramembrane metalloprotease [Alphaproteobacteria bacterium]